MSAFEYWHEYKTEECEIYIYISRDCDMLAIESGELEPGKVVDFQMTFEKLFQGKVIREYYNDNALIAGEWLRDEIGYGPAKDALTAMNIPKDVLVWKFGEKG